MLQPLCAEKQARIVLSSQGLDYTLVQVETTYSKLSYEELGPTPYPGVCLHSVRWQNYFITELGKPFDLSITDGPAMETVGRFAEFVGVRWRSTLPSWIAHHTQGLSPHGPQRTCKGTFHLFKWTCKGQGRQFWYSTHVAVHYVVLPIRIPLYGQRIIDQSIRSYHGPNGQIIAW